MFFVAGVQKVDAVERAVAVAHSSERLFQVGVGEWRKVAQPVYQPVVLAAEGARVAEVLDEVGNVQPAASGGKRSVCGADVLAQFVELKAAKYVAAVAFAVDERLYGGAV